MLKSGLYCNNLIKKLAPAILLSSTILFADCKNPTNKNIVAAINGVTYFDSIKLGNFLIQNSIDKNEQEAIKQFYRQKNNALVWFDDAGLNAYAKSFIALLNSDDSLQKKYYFASKQELYNKNIISNIKFNINDTSNITFDFSLTLNFINYAQQHWVGISQEKIKQAGWFITKNNISSIERLQLFLKNDIQKNKSYQPVNRQYNLLNAYLKKYTALEKKSDWATNNITAAKKGDSALSILLIKEQLFLQGDLVVNDHTNVFNDSLEEAVKKFQHRLGIAENGIVAGKTLMELNVSIHQRIEQLMINIERSKWMPIEQEGDYLAVNIPDFKLLVYTNNTLEWSCNVVVGKSNVSSNTIIFNDSLVDIVFSPYWNVPPSIMLKETLPAIRSNRYYLSSHNMEVIDENNKIIPLSRINQSQLGKGFPYSIRQKPGKNNSLGLVKFLFPNNYNIYMHDTPEKSLFNESTRMFSHGCIRVEEPIKLAKFLLRNDSTWTDEKIATAMDGTKEIYVKLHRKIPVYIAYFTAWVDKAGNLNFRDDIYHHDSKMKELLF